MCVKNTIHDAYENEAFLGTHFFIVLFFLPTIRSYGTCTKNYFSLFVMPAKASISAIVIILKYKKFSPAVTHSFIC